MADYTSQKRKTLTFNAAGSAAMNTTLDAGDAVDAGGGIVTILSTGHGFKAGSMVYIGGSTNYDGTHTLVAVAADTFNIRATYVAETFAGTETVTITLAPVNSIGTVDFEFKEIRLHVDAAPTTAANFTITVDSNLGANYDVILETFSMAGNPDVSQIAEPPLPFVAGDKLVFGWANADGDTWGLEVKYLRRA